MDGFTKSRKCRQMDRLMDSGGHWMDEYMVHERMKGGRKDGDIVVGRNGSTDGGRNSWTDRGTYMLLSFSRRTVNRRLSRKGSSILCITSNSYLTI